jgi:hypothetical protein
VASKTIKNKNKNLTGRGKHQTPTIPTKVMEPKLIYHQSINLYNPNELIPLVKPVLHTRTIPGITFHLSMHSFKRGTRNKISYN